MAHHDLFTSTNANGEVGGLHTHDYVSAGEHHPAMVSKISGIGCGGHENGLHFDGSIGGTNNSHSESGTISYTTPNFTVGGTITDTHPLGGVFDHSLSGGLSGAVCFR
jgi:hypothetical protein